MRHNYNINIQFHSEAKLLFVTRHPLVNHINPYESFHESFMATVCMPLRFVWVSSRKFHVKGFKMPPIKAISEVGREQFTFKILYSKKLEL